MKRFTLRHELDCTRNEMWKAFLRTEDVMQMYRDLEFPEFRVLELVETDTTITRRSQGVPKLNLPAPVAKVLGGRFSYVEEGTFDKLSQVWRFKMIPGTMPDKLHHIGSMTLEDIGPSRICRVVELELEANVFGLSSVIEAAFEKQLRDTWAHSALVTNALFLKRRTESVRMRASAPLVG